MRPMGPVVGTGIDGSDLEQLADEVDRLGDVPRYATAAAVLPPYLRWWKRTSPLGRRSRR